MAEGGESRFLVVGMGAIARRHIANLRALAPRARVAAWRLTPEGAAAPPPQGVDQQVTSLEAALATRPQAALVCSPASLHADQGAALARAGVHLFLEKPLAHQAQAGRALVQACREEGVILQVGYNFRHHPPLREAARLVAAGELGRVYAARAEVGQYLPDWRPGMDYRRSVSARPETGGGALLELSHEIDLALWLLGPAGGVSARLATLGDLGLRVEDVALLSWQAPGGALVSLHLDILARPGFRRLGLWGTGGSLAWDGLQGSLSLCRAGESTWRRISDPDPDWRQAMYRDELAHFLACLEGRAQPRPTGEEGLAVLEVVEAARAAAGKGARP